MPQGWLKPETLWLYFILWLLHEARMMNAHILLDQTGKRCLLVIVRGKKPWKRWTKYPSVDIPGSVPIEESGYSCCLLGFISLQTSLWEGEIRSALLKPCDQKGRNSFFKWKKIKLLEGRRDTKCQLSRGIQNLWMSWTTDCLPQIFCGLLKWPQVSVPHFTMLLCNSSL